jgi:hypothetical protein
LQGLPLRASDYDPPAELLRSLVEEAFSPRSYPGGDRIADEGRLPGEEAQRVASFFQGKDWRQVSRAALRDRYPGDPSEALRFMFDEGFRYYLPAFLLIALEPEGEADEITDALCFALTDPAPRAREDSRRFHARMAGLSRERAAVTGVLRHLADRYDRAGEPDNSARDALDSYWELFTR